METTRAHSKQHHHNIMNSTTTDPMAHDPVPYGTWERHTYLALSCTDPRTTTLQFTLVWRSTPSIAIDMMRCKFRELWDKNCRCSLQRSQEANKGKQIFAGAAVLSHSSPLEVSASDLPNIGHRSSCTLAVDLLPIPWVWPWSQD